MRYKLLATIAICLLFVSCHTVPPIVPSADIVAQEAAELTEQAGAVSAGAIELFALVSPEIRPQAASLVQAAAVMEDKARKHEATISKLREELGAVAVQIAKLKRDLASEKKRAAFWFRWAVFSSCVAAVFVLLFFRVKR